MNESINNDILFLFLALLFGASIGFLLARFYLQAKLIRPEKVEKDYILKAIHTQLQQQSNGLKEDLTFAEQEIRKMSAAQSSAETQIRFLEEKIATQSEEVLRLQEQARLEFENVANRLLEEKSEKFSLQNKLQLDGLLQPLREKIKEFGDGVQQRFVEETKQRSMLQQEMEHLRKMNAQLSQDANNLVNALKGENKTQGDWGEYQLELLLEKSGLQKGIHYRTQASFKDKDGKQKRPDFIIELPEGKHLILDAKVSLSAYERYFNCEDEKERQIHLHQHIDSLKRHIKDLSSKNYQQLYQINAPDYLLLFVPIEPAFAIASQHAPRLFLDALDQNIVIVTSSTLLATMRTVAYIWKQERQKKNVLEIARQSGLLYDKFVGFVEDLKMIGQRLEDANTAYQGAMNKLKDSPKYGDTLVGRSERIRELGAKASKRLSSDLLGEDLGE
ncbi:MAG: DNA recombination protein RmuC [Bacteroidota bacterium]